MTNVTFVSADGITVSYSDLFRGAFKFIESLESKKLISANEAEDLAQQSALKLLLGAARYDSSKSSARTFGNRVAQNCYIDFWNRKKMISFEPLSDFAVFDRDHGEILYSGDIEKHALKRGDVEADIISKESVGHIMAAIDALDEKDRKTLRMTIGGYKPRDISKELGCTPDAVSVRLTRARRKLRGLINQTGPMEEYGFCA